MIKDLLHCLFQLPEMLDKPALWDSLLVNKRKPHTYRVFHNFPDGMRVCLHKFDPCHDHEAFKHPHPWPAAFILLQGSYEMTVNYSCNGQEDDNPVEIMKTVFKKHSIYEITNPLTWHAVVPLETTYTVMLNGLPWGSNISHKNVVTTKGKDLDKMPENELLEHLDIFKNLINEWFK